MAYTAIEYIESTGTQYINTGYFADNKTKVEIKFNIEQQQDGYIFGARSSSLYYDFSLCKEGNTMCLYYGTEYNGDIYASYIENDIVAECEVNKLVLNGQEYADTTAISDYECAYEMYIFCTNKRNEVYKIATMKFYYMEIWDNGTLVFDLIPVLDENNVACLYNKVTGTYLYNAGTGDFVAGSVIQNPIITIGTPSKTKISHADGCNQSVVTFQSDMELQAWEARATIEGQTIGHGSGLLVESGGSLAANTDATVYVDCTELTQGDREYTISVFGQSTDGRWSDG